MALLIWLSYSQDFFSQILAFRPFTNLFFEGTQFEVKEKGVEIGLKNNDTRDFSL